MTLMPKVHTPHCRCFPVGHRYGQHVEDHFVVCPSSASSKFIAVDFDKTSRTAAVREMKWSRRCRHCRCFFGQAFTVSEASRADAFGVGIGSPLTDRFAAQGPHAWYDIVRGRCVKKEKEASCRAKYRYRPRR